MLTRRLRPLLMSAALGTAIGLIASSAMAIGEPPKVALRPAPAESTAPLRVAPVTVEAAKPAELRKQTYGFVQTFAATSVKLDQVARWTQPVCVTVQGLPADANAEVKARVEEVSKALGVGALPAGCKPSIQIAFTDQPQALLDRIAAQSERLLGYWHHRDRDKLKTVTHPVQAWYVTGTAGSGGNTVGVAFANIESGGSAAFAAPPPVPTGAAGRQPHGFMYDDEENDRSPTGCGDKAAFTVCLSSEFQHVLVVIDTGKAGAYPPGLIADYVVMLAMAQPRSLDGCNVLPSVIDLFSKGCPGRNGEDGLTRGDVAYLTALYKTDLEARKSGQMTDIAGRMADMLQKASAADRLTIQAAAAAGAPAAGKK